MVDLTVRSLLKQLPLYCEDCSDNHLFSMEELEMVIYVLQAQLTEPDLFGYKEMDCLERVVRYAGDSEMYLEYSRSRVISRLNAEGIPCPDHTSWPGPHHSEQCCYYDEEES